MGNSILLSKNRLDYTSTIAISTGTGKTVLYDRDKNTQWSSQGSNDAIVETITITFVGNRTMDRLLLLNHNIKSLELWQGGTMLLAESNIASQNYYGSFGVITAQEITLKMFTTQIANQEKKIGELMLLEEYYTLAVNPSSMEVNGREKSKEIELNDGTKKLWKIAGSERIEMGWKFDGINIGMCNALENLKKTAYKHPFNVYLFPSELPDEIFLMNWTNPFAREILQAWDGAGNRAYNLKIELAEV